jgi:NADH dehydrogenase [ubiquinone] 1 alpha subcomplex assembly factor 7
MERLDHFMARANATYYAAHDPYADFTTAPEISQVFGELLGLWAATVWESMGRPDPVILAELGPGRGTLMQDALRAIRAAAPRFGTALRLHLVETSPRLRTLQAERLDATWHDTLATLPSGPMLLLANEFLDALPIRQFVRRPDGWAERYVDAGVAADLTCELNADLSSPARDSDGDLVDGVVERCEPALDIARLLGSRFAASSGAALFLDYGSAGGGDTLQAIRGGKFADPFAEAGEADLTAHVDFDAFAASARDAGAAVTGPASQGVFLLRLGLLHRSERLAREQSPERAAALLGAARRLSEPHWMGRLFQVLAVHSAALPAPPGFAA